MFGFSYKGKKEKGGEDMSQYEYQVICHVIKSGAPAIANDLITSLNNLIAAYNAELNKAKDEKQKVDEKVKKN